MSEQKNYGTLRQPMSIPNDETPVWDLVLADIRARDEMGAAKYRTRLQPNNGRDGLADLYQELLDAVAYVRLVLAERDTRHVPAPKPLPIDVVRDVMNEHLGQDEHSSKFAEASPTPTEWEISLGHGRQRHLQNIGLGTVRACVPTPNPRISAEAFERAANASFEFAEARCVWTDVIRAAFTAAGVEVADGK